MSGKGRRELKRAQVVQSQCSRVHIKLLTIYELVKLLQRFLTMSHTVRKNIGFWIFYTELRLTAAGIRCADHVTPSIRKSWH
jgi:hypothetical protein